VRGTLSPMGYKLLGFVVWQGVKLYLRRRLPSSPPKAALAAGVAGVVLAGGALVAVQRRSAAH
jgi:hypothetical protein